MCHPPTHSLPPLPSLALADNQIYLSNLDYFVTPALISQFVEEMLCEEGCVVACEMLTKGSSAQSGAAGLAMVELKSATEAKRAVRELNEAHFMGRTLYVSLDKFMSD